MNEERNLEHVLDECLQALAQGVSLEACLERHADLREDLEPLLRAALWVQAQEPARPDPAFRAASRRRLVAYARQELARESGEVVSRPGWPKVVTKSSIFRLGGRTGKSPAPFQTYRRWTMFWALVFAVVALLGGGGVVYASTDALPGDSLYPVKLMVEEAQVRLASDEEEVALRLKLAEERLEEARLALEEGQTRGLERALANYEAHLERALALAQERAQADPAVWAMVEQHVQQHQERLQQLLEAMKEHGTPMTPEAEQHLERVRRRLQEMQHMPGTPQGPMGPGGEGQEHMPGMPQGPMGPGGEGQEHMPGTPQGPMGPGGEGQEHMPGTPQGPMGPGGEGQEHMPGTPQGPMGPGGEEQEHMPTATPFYGGGMDSESGMGSGGGMGSEEGMGSEGMGSGGGRHP